MTRMHGCGERRLQEIMSRAIPPHSSKPALRRILRGVRTVFHRPHPAKEADRGAVKSMRRFLEEAEVSHDEL